MAVMITDSCINCDSCIEECPATAIVSADDSPVADRGFCYVKPEKCIECVDAAVPKCADVCPTEDCIVWDMPYTEPFNDHFVKSDDYVIRVHKKKGLLSPIAAPRPYREAISQELRQMHASVGSTLTLHPPK
jgi:ferredoxin